MLYALLVTDEVAMHDSPCSDALFVADFMSFDPIFGAILVEDIHHNVSLPLFVQSIGCLMSGHEAASNTSIVETNSSVSPGDSFHALYDSVEGIQLSELGLSANACDVMAVNVTWPGIEFEDILSSDGLFS